MSQILKSDVLEPLMAPAPWQAFAIDSGCFPVDPARRESIRETAGILNGVITRAAGGGPELFLQVSQLHVDGGTGVFAQHAREWSPSMGLGISPTQGPPQTWGREDFEKLEPGNQLRPMSHKLFRIGASKEREPAWNLMFGRGITLLIYSPDSEAVLKQMRDLFLPTITEKIFRRYPFFVSLLDRKAVEGASSDQFDRWSCGLTAYVRESVEDHSILIVSRLPLRQELESAGLTIRGLG